MASVTLAESAKLAQDELVAGVIETVITINQFFQLMRFDAFDGNSLQYNRENVMGAVGPAGVGTDLSGAAFKAAATFTKVNVGLTKIIGDAEVDNLIQATRSGDGNDQEAIQIASKAKHIGREYQRQFINGTGTGDEFEGVLSLCAAGQKTTPSTNGDALSFEVMDELMDLVEDKDGVVDYIQMNKRPRRAYRSLLRALGGASIQEVFTLPSGEEVIAYSSVPVFRNDYIPVDQTQGTSSAATSIIAGTIDEGARETGIAGLTASNAAGIQVVPIGEMENKDETLTRIRWYCSLALFSEKGLAVAPGITD